MSGQQRQAKYVAARRAEDPDGYKKTETVKRRERRQKQKIKEKGKELNSATAVFARMAESHDKDQQLVAKGATQLRKVGAKLVGKLASLTTQTSTLALPTASFERNNDKMISSVQVPAPPGREDGKFPSPTTQTSTPAKPTLSVERDNDKMISSVQVPAPPGP